MRSCHHLWGRGAGSAPGHCAVCTCSHVTVPLWCARPQQPLPRFRVKRAKARQHADPRRCCGTATDGTASSASASSSCWCAVRSHSASPVVQARCKLRRMVTCSVCRWQSAYRICSWRWKRRATRGRCVVVLSGLLQLLLLLCLCCPGVQAVCMPMWRWTRGSLLQHAMDGGCACPHDSVCSASLCFGSGTWYLWHIVSSCRDSSACLRIVQAACVACSCYCNLCSGIRARRSCAWQATQPVSLGHCNQSVATRLSCSLQDR